MQDTQELKDRNFAQRRKVLQLAGAATVLSASSLTFAQSAGRTVRIGWVSPETGPLAPFGEVDQFVNAGVTQLLKSGITIAGKNHPVEIIVKDSQSSPNRAAEVASELILKNKNRHHGRGWNSRDHQPCCRSV